MKKINSAILMLLTMVIMVFMMGCTITNGSFLMMNEQSSDTSFGANYRQFNGSITRHIRLQTGDQVTFSYLEDEELTAIVKQGEDTLLNISDGSVYIVPKDGQYEFLVEGFAEDGEFLLKWEIE